jgi:hypothetical protein
MRRRLFRNKNCTEIVRNARNVCNLYDALYLHSHLIDIKEEEASGSLQNQIHKTASLLLLVRGRSLAEYMHVESAQSHGKIRSLQLAAGRSALLMHTRRA